MNSNTILSAVNHPQSILTALKSTDGLPFREILSSKAMEEDINNIEYSDRAYPPDVTV